MINHLSDMKNKFSPSYEAPAAQIVPLTSEIVFCGPSTGERFLAIEDYGNGWIEDL